MSVKTTKLSQNEQLIKKVVSGHKHKFGSPPVAVAYAPGRIEVLGNHTDYNEGYVLSAAIDAGICAAVSAGEKKQCVLAALDLGEEAAFELPAEKPVENPHWANYLIGVVNKLGAAGEIKRGFNLTFAGDVPAGAGLSSSAAMEVAAALALCDFFNLRCGNLEKVGPDCQSGRKDGGTRLSRLTIGQKPNSSIDLIQLARLCQQAENEFTGARCGLLDQISSLFGAEHSLIFTDFRSLAVEPAPMNADTCFLLANTQVKHNLVESAYNERRAACECAAQYFASVLDHPVRALRDVSMAELKKHGKSLDPVVARRAAHIIGENERVLAGRQLLRAGKMKDFGRLMFDSHQSSRLNFENSCDELDFIVDIASRLPQVLGARLSGGGFGGSAVLLIHPDDAAEVGRIITEAYAGHFHAACDVRVIKPSAGARLVKNVQRIS